MHNEEENGVQAPAVPPLSEEQEEQLLAMGFDPMHQPDGTTHWRLHQYDLDILRQELASRQEGEDPYSDYEDDDDEDDEDEDPYVFPWDTLAGVYSYGTWRDNGNINGVHIENGNTPVADRVQVDLRNDQQQMYINIQPGSPDGRHIQEVVIERNGRRWVIPLKDDLTKPGLPDI